MIIAPPAPPMTHHAHPNRRAATGPAPLRVGFVALCDAAPLIVAHELGFFKRHGLRVALQREPGWASIRDKIVHGRLDAAHAVAGLPFAATLGAGCVPCDCITALVLSLHGNAITLAQSWIQRDVTSAHALRQATLTRRPPALTFGIVHPFSSHACLLHDWLVDAGFSPDTDARLVVVPPPQMVPNLLARHLDGFCVGEPWNTEALAQAAGNIVACSNQLAPGHPEKVLMVRREFAERRSDEHSALLRALLEACAWCDDPDHRPELPSILTRPSYLPLRAQRLRPGFIGPFPTAGGADADPRDFYVFHRDNACEPSPEKADWILRRLHARGAIRTNESLQSLAARVYRADLFHQATQSLTAVSSST